MNDWAKVAGTVVFGGAAVVLTILAPSEAILRDVFVALLSAIWVIPPVAKMLKLQ